MKKNFRPKVKIELIYFLIFILADQLSKIIVLKYWPNYIFKNTALGFGIFNASFALYVSLASLIILLILVQFSSLKNNKIAIALVAAGALGNIIDRYAYGAIIDFIPFFSISKFNLADMEIFLGLLLFVKQIFGQNLKSSLR